MSCPNWKKNHRAPRQGEAQHFRRRRGQRRRAERQACSGRCRKQIKARIEDNRVTLERSSEDRKVRALHGLSRTLVNNMVKGVTDGFVKELEIQGVGFKAAVQGKNL